MIFPDYLLIKSIDVISNQPIVTSEARNLKVLSRELSGHRFDLNMRIEVEPWNAKKAGGFFFGLQQDSATVEFSDAEWASSASNKTVSGAVSAGVRDLTLNNVTDLNIGDWANVAGHAKLYRIIDIVGSMVTLNTPLHDDVADMAVFTVDAPEGIFELHPDLKRNAVFASKLDRELSNISLRLIEVV